MFLKNVNDFPVMNEAYAKFFGEYKPARSTVEVARIPRDVLIEIEAITLYVAGSSHVSGLRSLQQVAFQERRNLTPGMNLIRRRWNSLSDKRN